MSALTKVRAAAPVVVSSTNFSLQAVTTITLIVLFAGSLVAFPEDLLNEIIAFVGATISAVVGFYGRIREWTKDGVKFRYNSNSITYLLMILTGFVPWLADYDIQAALESLIGAITSGNLNLLLPAAFALINIIVRITTDKPWQNREPAPVKDPAPQS